MRDLRSAVESEPAWVDEVIRFWLVETAPDARFKRSDALDQAASQRFTAVHATLSGTDPAVLAQTPRTALAAVIVLDQLSRNMFRGRPEAFAQDARARAIAEAALTAGHDQALDKDGRLFLYLPFEHSERLPDQDQSVALIATLGDADLDRYAKAHRDIILRFGRFPHRNAALGRASTPEEEAFLREPGSSF